MGDVKKVYDKKKAALSVIFSAAEEYEKNLNGNNLLFLFLDKHKNISYFEVEFNSGNFMHLTGIRLTGGYKESLKFNSDNNSGSDIDISYANKFYEKCINKKIGIDEFEFSDDGTTWLKLQVLPALMKSNLSANMLGDFTSRTCKLYTEKVAGNVRGCMGFVRDMKVNKNVPNTVLKSDIRDCVSAANRIIATYRKKKTETVYREIVYMAKNVDFNKIKFPKEISYLKNINYNNETY